MYQKCISGIMLAILMMGVLSMQTAVASTSKSNIQDTKKAAQYFEEELSYKTNPHGVNAVLNGEVKNVTIVDVRTEKDYVAGHIPGAINIPYDKYNGFDGDEKEFPGLRKDGYNYVYCYQLLCNLSQTAAKKFASVGYPVKEIVGGYQSWTDGKYPVVTGNK